RGANCRRRWGETSKYVRACRPMVSRRAGGVSSRILLLFVFVLNTTAQRKKSQRIDTGWYAQRLWDVVRIARPRPSKTLGVPPKYCVCHPKKIGRFVRYSRREETPYFSVLC